MAGSLKNIGLTSLDDLFKTDEQRQADAQERVQIVPADQVFPYARQPYSVDRPTQDLAQLMDSIERVGIAEPLIVRPRDGGGYEIIAGHRRDYCAKAIGLETRPVIVREYSDEDADILVVDYNIHRDDLLPSEKARAYKLRLEAMKRKAGRPSINSTQVGPNLIGTRSNEDLAQQANESKTQIQRYIRLNSLIPSLLERVDSGTLKFVPAAESISYLTEKEQIYLAMVMERDEVSPSMDQAKRLKQLSAEGKLVENIIDLIIIDPEREYGPLVRALGGEIITISASSDTYINAMDISSEYGGGQNPLALKSDFIMSLCEQIMGAEQISARDKSIIDRCTANVYREYIKTYKGDPPTLKDLHDDLMRQKEPAAHDIALALELFTTGILIVHCASSYNNVVITGKEGFVSVGRPRYFAE